MKGSDIPRFRPVLLPACACLLLVLLLVPAVLAADCASGCSCLLPEEAQKLGYSYCSGRQLLCSSDSAQRPMYCYEKPATLLAVTRTLVPGITTTTTTVPSACPTGCQCLTDDQARAQLGNYEHCSETPCAKAVTGSATLVAYCSKASYPACPSGCECMNELQARERSGTYERCPNTQQCAATTAVTANYPPYCFHAVTTTTPQPACPSGCDCLTEARARERFGEGGFTRCSADSCGSESMTTAAYTVNKYCFQQSATVLAAAQCPSGCACMGEADAKLKGYPPCRGQRTSCGYDATQVQLFCYEVVPSTTCTYDYQQNACSGTCQQGYSCSIIAQEKDATGAVKYGVCGCQPPATGCAYNANLNDCTGTCTEGTCAVTGKTVGANGAEQPVCGCHTESCTFDYAKDSCTGSCPAGSGICQLNTLYRDSAGKTIYGECHCKGAEQTPVTVTVTKTTPVPSTCTCSAGTCTGNCPDGQACRMTATATDTLGKISCTRCACTETCTLTAADECTGTCPDGSPCTKIVTKDEATGAEKAGCACGGTAGAPAGTATPAPAPAPDIVSAIANFFKSLFGMK